MISPAGEEIINPRTGQRMCFEREGGALLIHTFNPPGEGSMSEPVHVHPFQLGSWEVLEGRLVIEAGGETTTISAGDRVDIPAGTPHRYRTDGVPVHSVQRFDPALDTQQFFESWFALGDRGEIDDTGLPGKLRLAQMVWRFQREIRTVSPPWAAQLAFALALLPIARLRLGSVEELGVRHGAGSGQESDEFQVRESPGEHH